MTTTNRLQQALDDFYTTLNSLQTQGTSQLAELARLKLLIDKYPDHAHQMITEHHQPSPARAAGHPPPTPNHHPASDQP